MSKQSRPLYRSHRLFGYEVARVTGEDGTELVILQTGPHRLDVSPAHMLMPVTAKEAAFEATVALSAAIEQAQFLGLSTDEIRAAFESALQFGE